ncbi:nitrate regulatory protein [Isoalcanivorax indicus]|uniref:nitrate regulatory protein n=1 Tax=Isoalcanivorax indicus TaxID=2202653 RepID=UPI000DB992F1|nr:nitrate regulatory protein [Isoalcanivorax indicus]
MSEADSARPCATDFLIASKQCEIDGLAHFLRMGQLVAAISNLVHALQRERGASNVFLGSDGERFAHQLQALSADADGAMQGFFSALKQVGTRTSGVQGGARLFSRIAHAVHVLGDLSAMRARVRALKLAPEQAVHQYSELVRALLAVVFEAADSAMDPTISAMLVAMFNLMQGKETAGQERAVGAAGFARGEFDIEQARRMQHLIEAQERCFEIFTGFADPDSVALWQALLAGTDQAEVERFRRMACTGLLPSSLTAEQADRWFQVTTERIDAMKRVEDHLEQRLQSLCEEKLHEARERLARHQSLIEQLLDADDGQGESFMVFCATGSSADGQGETPERYDTEGVSPQLGRAIIEMVQTQGQRLQRMQDELNAAREALEERKVLERAKALLMKHRKLQEDEAHRLLRQMAMNQGKRLIEVARAVVAMADVLGN